MMKKLLLMMLLVVGGVMSASAADVSIFLNANMWTVDDNTKLSLYMFKSSDTSINEWCDFEQIETTNFFKATLKDGYNRMIFVRKAKSSNNWTNSYNQTDDITEVPTTNALYKITSWHIDNDDKKNSGYEKRFDFPSLKLRGSFDSWAVNGGIDMPTSDCINYSCVLTPNNNDDIEFKLVVNNDYLGYDKINDSYGHLFLDDSNNWISDGGGNDRNLVLSHSTTLYASYNVSAKWTLSDDWWKGWTLSISGNDFKTISVSVTSAGYATFSSAYPLTIPANDANIAAYRADRINNNGEIIFKKVSGNIAAGTGLLLKSINGGEANTTFSYVANGSVVSDNMMVGTPTLTDVPASTTDSYNYMLASTSTNGIGFYNVASATTSAAGKAYLHTTKALTPVQNARASWSFEDDTTTGIDAVKNEKQSNEVYNLNGQRVNNAVRGLYIVNGKKVIMK